MAVCMHFIKAHTVCTVLSSSRSEVVLCQQTLWVGLCGVKDNVQLHNKNTAVCNNSFTIIHVGTIIITSHPSSFWQLCLVLSSQQVSGGLF